MRITITKEMEGKTVYAIPTGNNSRRGVGEQKVKTFEVSKVKRKYVELKSEYGRPDNYDPTSGATQDQINRGYGGNAGYMFFESLEAIETYKTFNKKLDQIRDKFRYQRVDLTLSEVEQIHEMLFKSEVPI